MSQKGSDSNTILGFLVSDYHQLLTESSSNTSTSENDRQAGRHSCHVSSKPTRVSNAHQRRYLKYPAVGRQAKVVGQSSRYRRAEISPRRTQSSPPSSNASMQSSSYSPNAYMNAVGALPPTNPMRTDSYSPNISMAPVAFSPDSLLQAASSSHMSAGVIQRNPTVQRSTASYDASCYVGQTGHAVYNPVAGSSMAYFPQTVKNSMQRYPSKERRNDAVEAFNYDVLMKARNNSASNHLYVEQQRLQMNHPMSGTRFHRNESKTCAFNENLLRNSYASQIRGNSYCRHHQRY